MNDIFKPLTIFIIVLLLIVGLYLFLMYRNRANKTIDNNSQQTSIDQINMSNNDSNQNDFTDTSPKIVYKEEPAFKNAKYFQKVVNINGQLTYFSYPLEINPDEPPILIIYNHGSAPESFVSTNLKATFMMELQVYAKQFSNNGYAFIASNEHGVNYGNQDSLNDITNSINYIETNYKIQPKVEMIGYSMGGYPTINYAFEHFAAISKIALLAPATDPDDRPNYYKLKDISIKIWHGDSDLNVPQQSTIDFYNYMVNVIKDKKIKYVNIPGAAHGDVDSELAPDIYKFFSEK